MIITDSMRCEHCNGDGFTGNNITMLICDPCNGWGVRPSEGFSEMMPIKKVEFCDMQLQQSIADPACENSNVFKL